MELLMVRKLESVRKTNSDEVFRQFSLAEME